MFWLSSLAGPYRAHIVGVRLIVVVHVAIIKIDVVGVRRAVLGTRPIVARFVYPVKWLIS